MAKSTLYAFALAVSLLALLAPAAHAKDPADILGGRIIITGKTRLPMQFKSAGEFVSKVKRAENHVIWPENKTAKDKTWSFEYIAFFRRPLEDREITVKIYQVDGGSFRLMPNGVFEQYLRNRGERIYSSSIRLSENDEFEMNKKYLVTIENRRQRLASSPLILRAEGPKYSGKVEFSEEDAKAKD